MLLKKKLVAQFPLSFKKRTRYRSYYLIHCLELSWPIASLISLKIYCAKESVLTLRQAWYPERLTPIQSCRRLCLSVSNMDVQVLLKMSLLEVLFDSWFLFEFLSARQALMKKVYSLLFEIQNLDWMLFLFVNQMHLLTFQWLDLLSDWNLVFARHLLCFREIGLLSNIFWAVLIYALCIYLLFLTVCSLSASLLAFRSIGLRIRTR